ncbi:MAG: AI-2E family transporter [Armatimonadota bacterium]
MTTRSWLRITSWAAVLLAVAAALHIIQILYLPVIKPVLDVLLPLSFAFALALLLDSTIDRIQRRGISRGAAVGIVALAFVAVIVISAVFLIPALIDQAKELAKNAPTYTREAGTYINGFMSNHRSLLERVHLPTSMEDISTRYGSQIENIAAASFSRVGTWLGGLLSSIVWLVIIPIVTIFLLIDIDKIKAKALLLAPERHRERTASLANSVGRVFGAYIRGLLTVAVLYGIACGVVIRILGVPYAVILGAAAGVLSLVPYIGTISTVILAGTVAMVASGNPMMGIWAALAILVMNQAFDNAVTPKIVGKAVGLHPALSIISLLIGARMFGFVGMIISVPVAASIQILVLEFYPPLRGPKEEEKPKKPSLFARIKDRVKKQK